MSPRIRWTLILVFLTLVLAICAGGLALRGGLMSRPDDQNAHEIAFSSLPLQSISRDTEYREARMLPPGLNAVDVGPVPDNGALRLSYAARGIASSPPAVRIYCDGRLAERLSGPEGMAWSDVRVDLAGHAGADCRVVFDAGSPLWVAACELTPTATQRPNVLVVLIDTLRPDHLGCYGYARTTSPHMDALAADGVILHDTFSQASWTRPAVGTLFTSVYPKGHGAVDRPDLLRQDLPTLAQAFRDDGYETHAFVANPSVLPQWGFGPGFTRYGDIDAMVVESGKDAHVIDAGIAAIEHAQGRPWFLYLHAMGPHSPYDPPAPYDARFVSEAAQGEGEAGERARTVDLYDGEIAFTDAQVGRLIERLKALDLYDDTLILVLSDHGEEFWEHGGLGHGTALYDEQIWIPCILKLPGGAHAGGARHGVAQLMDLGPTLLDLAGIPAPPSFQGVSLRTLIAEGDIEEERPAYASLYLEQHNQYTARTEDYKYIRDAVADTRVWFDLAVDDGERRPRPLRGAPPTAAELASYASRIVAMSGAGLHILVTGSLRDPNDVTFTLHGPGLDSWRLRYPARNGSVEMAEDGLHFTMATAPGPDCPPGLVEWIERGGEPNNAHLVVRADPDAPLTITARLNGRPMPADRVRIGADMRPASLDGKAVLPLDLVALSEQFDPSVLPRELAAYVWYVPSAGAVSDDALDPEMLDALESLGYL